MVQPVTHVIFDFGGVLLRWNPPEIAARFYADESLRERALQTIFRHPDWLEIDRGTLEEDQAVALFAGRMGRPVEEMWSLLQHVKESLTPIPESFALVRELTGRGVPVYGLSNMARGTFAHLSARHDLWRSFHGIVVSGIVKLVKPDVAIFEHIRTTFGLVPAQTAFIDDHAVNVAAAAQLGFRTILFREPAQCARELRTLLAWPL
jgi:putative hydrolase of the HAD superfamily